LAGQSNAGVPIQTFSPRRAGKIVETKLDIYSFVELQIHKVFKAALQMPLSWGFGFLGQTPKYYQ